MRWPKHKVFLPFCVFAFLSVPLFSLATDRFIGKKYGRIVGEVLLPDGISLNKQLVSMGLAWWYRKYAPNDRTLKALETGAREAKRGLWVDKDPVPPWEWRKREGDRRMR